jgi:HD domain-containing protein
MPSTNRNHGKSSHASALNDGQEIMGRSPLVESAWRFADEAHHGPRRRDDTDAQHPRQVAQELAREGFDEPVVAAALLHDVVEDTATGKPELHERFGPAVGALVSALTEDPAIEPYERRKAELRDRVIDGGYEATAIFVADKLANARALNANQESAPAEKMNHYAKTLAMARERFPHLPFLSELDAELRKLDRSTSPQDEAGTVSDALESAVANLDPISLNDLEIRATLLRRVDNKYLVAPEQFVELAARLGRRPPSPRDR